jgi:hypothetical protein
MRDGLLASFGDPEALMAATKALRQAGYRKLDAFTPFPMPELEEVLELPKSPVFFITLLGGMFGAGFGYFFQYYSRVIAYPLDVGGRPLHPWPTFIPITFEMTVLFAGLCAFFSCWALCGLPRLYRPLFEIERFRAATVDRFFLAVDASDPLFDVERTADALRSAGAETIDGVGSCR